MTLGGVRAHLFRELWRIDNLLAEGLFCRRFVTDLKRDAGSPEKDRGLLGK